MKISKIIATLQQDLEIHGDLEVVYSCECFENICDCFETPEDGNYAIGGFGWYSNADKGEMKIQLICAECHANALDDHIRGKYE